MDELVLMRARLLAFGRDETDIQADVLDVLEQYTEAVNDGDYDGMASRLARIAELGGELERVRWAKEVLSGEEAEGR